MFKKHEYFFLLINLIETPCTQYYNGTKNRHIEKKYDFATECTQQ